MAESGDRAPVDTVRKLTSEVNDAVNFLSYVGMPFYHRRYFQWKITHNPFGAAACYLRLRNGLAAAHTSITPKPVNDILFPGWQLAELGDTHTHPNFQRQGHFAALGKYVIEDFQKQSQAEHTLIYGLPNEQALPGWTRSIGCHVHEALSLSEMSRTPWQAIRSGSFVAKLKRRGAGLERSSRNASAVVDDIWARTDHSRWFVRKDARWWNWRYENATDSYVTYVSRDHAGSALAWIASKTSRTRWPGIRRVAICDVVGVTPEDEAEALHRFLSSVPRLIDVVHGWFQRDSQFERVLNTFGFRVVRRVPVIFADNAAYHIMKDRTRRLELAFGDTDNV